MNVLVIVLCSMISLIGCVKSEPVIILQMDTRTPLPGDLLPRTATPWIITATPEPTPNSTEPPPVPSVTPLPVVNLGYVSSVDNSNHIDDLHWFVAQYLSEMANLDVRAIEVSSNTKLGEMLCSQAVDLAWLSTPAYLIAHEQCDALAIYRGIRHGTAWHRGAILVQNQASRSAAGEEPIRTLEDLEGLELAYTMQESTSGYLLPRLLLQEADVELGHSVFYGGDRQAVLAAYRGEMDAAACYWLPIQPSGMPGDARALLKPTFPDIYDKLEILALTESIPNDPLVMRYGLDQDVRVAVVAGLAELAGSTEGRDLLGALYGLEGLVPTEDEDYDSVRELGDALYLEWRTLAD